MLSPALVIASSFAYLLLLFAVAYWADRRAQTGRSVIPNPWTYALSLAVYCTAWTYFGSVGRAASGGVWFLPIYLGPTLVMLLGWIVLRKMIRIAKAYRITSIADFIASRYGKSPLLAGLVTLIAVVGIVPYIALQLKAVSAGYALLTVPGGVADPAHWSRDSAFYVALVLAGLARGLALIEGMPALGLGALHALTMGCLGSLMLAMVTRVSCGHSGRAQVADSVAWSLFWLLQLATLLRIAASVPGRLSTALLLGAALLWAAVVAVWGVRLGSWYGRLRPDGRPG